MKRFSPEFLAKLHLLIAGKYQVADLGYEVIVGRYWVAEMQVKSLNGAFAMEMEVRIGRETSLEALETRVLQFFKR